MPSILKEVLYYKEQIQKTEKEITFLEAGLRQQKNNLKTFGVKTLVGAKKLRQRLEIKTQKLQNSNEEKLKQFKKKWEDVLDI